MVFVAGEMERRGFYDPAADRRRHHQPHPHGGEDRAGLRARLDHLCDRRQPRGRRGLGPDVADRAAEGRGRDPRRVRPHPRAVRPRPGGQGPHAARRRARQRASRIDWQAYTPPQPELHSARAPSRPTTWPSSPATSTGRRSSPAWELVGRYPGHPGGRRGRRGGARRSSPTRQAMLKQIIAETLVRGARRRRPLARQRRRRRHRRLDRRDPHRPSARGCYTLRQQMAKSEGRANVALADFVAPIGGRPDYIGGFAVTAGHGELEIAGAVQGGRRRLFRHPRHRARRPPRRGLRRGAAPPRAHRALGLRARRAVRPRRHDRREVPRHPPRARLSGPARPHREGDAVPPAGRRGRHRHRAHRELRHDAAGRRSPASTSPTRRPTTSASASIERDQVEDYARRKGWDLATAERWLAPILNYDPAKTAVGEVA